MARIRTIKPEFWTSEQIADCSPTARLLFVGLWNFSDDGGVHLYSAKRIKMEIFPGDDFCDADIHNLLDELLSGGLLRSYTVDNTRYLKVSGWRHQKIERASYKHPQPDENTKFDDHSTIIRRSFDDKTPPDVDVDVDVSSLEGKGCRKIPTTTEIVLADRSNSETSMRNCFEVYYSKLESLYPHANLPAEMETCIAHYAKHPVLDPYPVILKWMNRVKKERSLSLVSKQSEREQILADNAESCRQFAGGV